ncbi:MAG: vitamin B12-dependent ribonucleotide reductase, partial [Candidatus Dormibacteria bacterium]
PAPDPADRDDTPTSRTQDGAARAGRATRRGGRRRDAAGDLHLEGRGLHVERRFTTAGVHPFDEVQWELRTAVIGNEKGETVFEQTDCEVPSFWSQMATNVVVSKYFRGALGTPRRETSVKQMISRVVDTIAEWGRQGAYFASEGDAQAFQDELCHLILHQKMSFNSPVWFNLGVPGSKPQISACFINSVEDTMESILGLAKTEGMLFKYGSGTGTNLSPIRSSIEHLGGGGTASGPVSFMKGFDAFAGVIKSGGTTRRAAKMVILNADHPDVQDFITCKVDEEKKAWALIEAGYDSSFTGEAYASVFFQNSNNSVRVTDEFMRAVEEDKDWNLYAVSDRNRVIKTLKARELMRLMAESAWQCGDPGIQYDTTINDWHTSSNTGRINASNPCSEYMYLDDSSCNLASINLTRFLKDDGSIDVDAYRHAIQLTITAQEILVSNASYPTEKIAENSEDYRPLGLGYANLGALLMSRGAPYDSPQGRDLAACLTAVLTGEAYAQSARIAREIGPFNGYAANRQPMLRVIGKHREAAYNIPTSNVEADLVTAARHAWDEAHELGARYGFRNGQSSVIAPTGTISFMLDCDTTGVEPDIALVKYKKLVGGGMLKIVNQTVPSALRRLGYGDTAIADIVAYIDANDTIEGAPQLREEDVAVFDCAFAPQNGKRSIAWQGHLRMMAAVQPFVSGASSKTVNVPESASVEDIERAYIDGWKLGLKAVAIYRDGSKRSQPLATSVDKTTGQRVQVVERPLRKRLPSERQALTHRFEVSGHEGYITVGLYDDGQPGEIFLKMAKEGSTVSGLMDSFATAISLALQYGVPLQALVDKFSHTRFEPQGFTKNPEIPIAKSVMDYIFRWLASRFLSQDERDKLGIIRRDEELNGDAGLTQPAPTTAAQATAAVTVAPAPAPSAAKPATPLRVVQQSTTPDLPGAFVNQADAPSCSECGSLMVRNGACYKCYNCGATSGCS